MKSDINNKKTEVSVCGITDTNNKQKINAYQFLLALLEGKNQEQSKKKFSVNLIYLFHLFFLLLLARV